MLQTTNTLFIILSLWLTSSICIFGQTAEVLNPDVNIGRELTLGSPFQDRMILQRDKPIKIWGVSDAGKSINVSIAGHSINGVTDSSGRWEVELPSTPAGGDPQVLTVISSDAEGESSLTISDVLFGDVWFCFGQSNMRRRFSSINLGWRLFYTDAIANNDNIRCLRTVEDGALSKQEETLMTWLDNADVDEWSMVASVFAYHIHQSTNVPVAIIDSAWGSSSIEGWLPRELETEFPHFKEMLEFYQSINEYRDGDLVSRLVSNGSIGISASTNEEAISLLSGTTPLDDANIFMRTRPEIIYNERVNPLLRYGISGFVWYQGEANSINSLDVAQYQFTLPRMVQKYREDFGQGDLPFLGVQLPSHDSSLWPWFRESQDSLRSIPNSYVAVTVDTGSINNIHPPDKEELGIRLSLLVREHVFGEIIEGDSPRFASQSINGNEITLTFDHVNSLTTTDGASPAGFEVAGVDGVFHSATGRISANTIVISSAAEPAPVFVRYAWTPVTHNVVNTINITAQPSGSRFFNDTGLPLAPFRTDNLAIPGLIAQAPVGIDDSYSILRDDVLVVSANGVLENDFDLNKDDLEAAMLMTTSNGSLSLQSDGSFTYRPTAGFTGSDSFTYEVLESNGNLTSSMVTVSISVDAPTSYDIWCKTVAWSPSNDETENGDPDGDGITNLLEFALGLDPLENDLDGLPTLSSSAGVITYNFNNAQAGIRYEVQTSVDLQNWSGPAFAVLDSTDSTPVTIPSSAGDGQRLFVRLRVSIQE